MLAIQLWGSPPPNPISLAMREWGSDVSDLMVLVLASKRCKIHMAQERRYIAQSQWRRCFIVMSITVYIYISRTASRTQQAQQQQCRTVQQSEEIQGTGSSKSRKIWLDTPAFSLLRSYLKNALWEAPKGYPFRWVVPPPNDVHVHLQLKNTLSPPGHKLNSITYPLELKGTWKSVESKSISIEILLII